uniref:Nucleotide-diphospho-sugar transferase domain-containing protein n=2 Tax=Pinguiococcus pyrenoidosus TaxID=172671 RepID=A0A7R9Y8H9_9STRA|mmetsp:Transcript_10276/g.38928  ORF Transcript_10276/g.38928 Transcript_10276/m.38928 type:complete len:302 (+) Transcript_10276:765-1670(+)
MTVNDGQADLLLNFFCSAKRHNIDVRRHVIFASSAELAESLRGIGMTAYYNEVFGQFPTKAANAYGDRTFHKMMQLKVLAPYILSRMGYAVLFQDADLVWFRDPRKYFETADQNVDIFFMDDGARSRRFSPYFANSGFFYTKTGMNAVLFYWETLLQGLYFLRGVTSSHQEVMQRALSDLEGRIGMVTEILDIKEFVSGQQYHRNKAFMKRIKDGKDIPWVMHYCWTLSKVEKLEYMRLMDHWYISPAYDKKLDRAAMAYLQKNPHVRKAMLPASFLQSNLKWDVITSNRVKSWEHLCASD